MVAPLKPLGYNSFGMLDLSIVIVSYNVCLLLRDCLRSVYGNHGVSFQVCVVDNASSDDSPAMVREEFPGTTLVESLNNKGYAYANNLGLRRLGMGRSQGDMDQEVQAHDPLSRYFLLLNPDTVLPPDALKKMVDFMDAHPQVGIAGPKLVRQDGSLDLACRRSFPTPEVSFYRMMGLSRLFPKSQRFGRYNLTYLDPEETAEVDSVVGAFMMMRREVLEEVGLMDESFFLYGEDLDLALRIKDRGWKVIYYPKVTVLHYKGESSRQESYRATKEFYRAMLIFYEKHYARNTFFPLHILILAAIYLRGGIAYLQNLFRPRPLKKGLS